ncbi:MAG: hypothetical protein AAGU75_21905, partial [Bacillota bacterium]
ANVSIALAIIFHAPNLKAASPCRFYSISAMSTPRKIANDIPHTAIHGYTLIYRAFILNEYIYVTSYRSPCKSAFKPRNRKRADVIYPPVLRLSLNISPPLALSLNRSTF